MEVGKLFIALGFKAVNPEGAPAFVAGAKAAGDAASKAGKGMASASVASKSLRGHMNDLIGPMNIARLQLLAFVGGLTALAQQASKTAANLTVFENVTGLSTQRLQAWQQQAEMANVSGAELQTTIEHIQRSGAEISLGRGNIAPWALLGIDPRQDPFDVLNTLQARLQGMSPAMGTMLAGDLGLSPTIVSFLKEMKSLPKANSELILTDAEIKRLKAFNVEFNRVWTVGKRSLQKLGEVMLPIASTAVWMVDRMAAALRTATRGASELTEVFKAGAPILAAIGVVLAAAFFPVTTAIVGLLLLFEDLMTWSKGGNSLTGDLFGPFEKWRGTLKDIKEYIDDIKKGVMSLIDVPAGKIAEWFTETGLAEGAGTEQGTERGLGSRMMRMLGTFVSAAGNYSGEMYQDLSKGLHTSGKLYQAAESAVSTVINNYNINGAQDPRAVAEEVNRATKSNNRGTHATMPATAGGR